MQCTNFVKGDIVRRESWLSTTQARVIQVDPDGVTVKFKNGGQHKYAAHQLILVRSFLNQPKFKVGDVVEAFEGFGWKAPCEIIGGPVTYNADSGPTWTVRFDNGWENMVLESKLRHKTDESMCYGQPGHGKTGFFRKSDKLVLDEIVEETPDIRRAMNEMLLARCKTGYAHSVTAYTDADILTKLYPHGHKESAAMNPIKIETVTFVDGVAIDKLQDEHIYQLIKDSEDEIKRLNELQNKPKRINERITKLQDGINALVAELDKRDEK